MGAFMEEAYRSIAKKLIGTLQENGWKVTPPGKQIPEKDRPQGVITAENGITPQKLYGSDFRVEGSPTWAPGSVTSTDFNKITFRGEPLADYLRKMSEKQRMLETDIHLLSKKLADKEISLPRSDGISIDYNGIRIPDTFDHLNEQQKQYEKAKRELKKAEAAEFKKRVGLDRGQISHLRDEMKFGVNTVDDDSINIWLESSKRRTAYEIFEEHRKEIRDLKKNVKTQAHCITALAISLSVVTILSIVGLLL